MEQTLKIKNVTDIVNDVSYVRVFWVRIRIPNLAPVWEKGGGGGWEFGAYIWGGI